MASQLSVIIPTLNEQEALPEVLKQLKEVLDSLDEVIIVDGGSTDNTAAIINAYGYQIFKSNKQGRAAQMDFGARHAKGEYLCFLHADTLPPNDLKATVISTLSNDKVVLAGFTSIMKGEKTRSFISFLNYFKTYLLPLLYKPYAFTFKGLRLIFGDQLMFCRRSDYLKSGGFDPNCLIMEEAEFCLKMNQLGSIKQIKEKVYSSDRRVQKLGTTRALYIYITTALGWALGFSTEKLNARYKPIR
jgi:rSAM/selenodomain-associated transferase 2